MRNKRGLSGVVVSLILVLLSIVAVGIVWAVVSNVMSDYSDKIEMGVSAVTLKVVSNEISEIDNKAIIKIKRGIGEGNVSGVSIMFETANGDTFSVDKELDIKEQETKNIEVILTDDDIKVGEGDEYNYITSFMVYPKIRFKGKDTLGSSGAEATRKTPENLLDNPGFEEWGTDCTGFEAGTCPIRYGSWAADNFIKNAYKEESSIASIGKYILRVTSNAPDVSVSQNILDTEDLPSGKYVLSSWVMCSSDNARIKIQAKDITNDKSLEESVLIACDGEMHYIAIEWEQFGDLSVSAIPAFLIGGTADQENSFVVDQAAVYESIADDSA